MGQFSTESNRLNPTRLSTAAACSLGRQSCMSGRLKLVAVTGLLVVAASACSGTPSPIMS